jgi:hypothetical protein
LRPIGGLAQLARALAWQARGQRFDSAILHSDSKALTYINVGAFCFTTISKLILV